MEMFVLTEHDGYSSRPIAFKVNPVINSKATMWKLEVRLNCTMVLGLYMVTAK